MPTRRLVLDATDKEHFSLTLKNGQLTVGGDPTHPDIGLQGLKVLRLRCEVEVADASVRYTRPGEPAAELRPNQTLELAHFLIRHQAGPEPEEASADSKGVQRKRLFVVDGADRGRAFALNDPGRTTIGNNAKAADIVLHDLYAARLHCEVLVEGGRVTVTHLVGKGGTLLNGRDVTEAELKIGDVLRVGNSHLKYDLGEVDPEAKPEGDAPYAASSKNREFPDLSGSGTHKITAELPKTASDPILKLEGQEWGHFHIESLIGQGRAGVVFRAQDRKTGNTVALKVLGPAFPADDAELQHFAKTIKAVSQLRHPHLVGLFGAGKTGAHCWIAREYVEGESLAEVMERHRKEGKFRWKNACRMAIHLGGVLDFLEQNHVVHGELTPANILIETSTKSTKLANLMLDQALEGSELADSIREAQSLSEIHYRAPEQLSSDAAVDHCSNIYSLGALLYASVTGSPPYPGSTAAEITARMKEFKPARPSQTVRDLPAQFEAALLKMMSINRKDRPQSAAEMLETIEAIANMHEIAGCH